MQLCLLEEPLKTQKSKKENRSYALKCNLYLHFLIKQKLLIFREKMLMSAELEGCFTWFIYFWIILRWGITVPSFISLGYVWQILEKRTFYLLVKFFLFKEGGDVRKKSLITEMRCATKRCFLSPAWKGKKDQKRMKIIYNSVYLRWKKVLLFYKVFLPNLSLQNLNKTSHHGNMLDVTCFFKKP